MIRMSNEIVIEILAVINHNSTFSNFKQYRKYHPCYWALGTLSNNLPVLPTALDTPKTTQKLQSNYTTTTTSRWPVVVIFWCRVYSFIVVPQKFYFISNFAIAPQLIYDTDQTLGRAIRHNCAIGTNALQKLHRSWFVVD